MQQERSIGMNTSRSGFLKLQTANNGADGEPIAAVHNQEKNGGSYCIDAAECEVDELDFHSCCFCSFV